MKAVRVHQNGGPEVLRYEEIPVPEPGAGEALVKIEAIGLNYIDIYQRTGLYPLKVPFTLGMEGAGIVDTVGANVTEGKKGDRVPYSIPFCSSSVCALQPRPLGATTALFIPGASLSLERKIDSESLELSAKPSFMSEGAYRASRKHRE